MSRSVVLAFLSACALAPAAFGQIIYENVRYQHVTPSGRTYYYGGNDPRSFYWAELQLELDANCYNRYRYGAFSGGDRCGLGDGYISEKRYVYDDLFPYRNAARFGLTADDARNYAVRTAPLYFRKRDLLRTAEVLPDGSVLVPSHPRGVVVVDRARRDGDNGNAETTRPASTGKILIIPKPKAKPSDKPILASR